MITFICFILYTLNAPWWVYLLSIIGIICEFDTSNLVHRGDRIDFEKNEIVNGEKE